MYIANRPLDTTRSFAHNQIHPTKKQPWVVQVKLYELGGKRARYIKYTLRLTKTPQALVLVTSKVSSLELTTSKT